MSAWLTPWLTPTLLLVVAAAGLLVIVTDWRLSLLALAVQYVGASILVTQLVVPDVAAARLVAGLLVVGILALSSWQVHAARAAAAAAQSGASPVVAHTPTGLPFRIMATLMAAVAAVYVASQPAFTLPGLEDTPALNTASYVLMSFGLLNLGLTEAPLRSGMGLLMVLIGFEIFYAAVEPALAIVALLAGVEFSVALAASYLALVGLGGAERTEPG
jgi:hypothetical protein